MTTEFPMRRKDDNPASPVAWGVKKEIDLGHLLMTLMTLGAFFGWALHQEGRFVAAESAITELKNNKIDLMLLINQQHNETRQDLKDVSDKLDALTARGRK
jgi:hypothetical protein